MLIIRFARRGRKKQSFFDLVVAEKSQAVQKKYIEKIGYMNPLSDGGKGEFVFDVEKIKTYIANGAQVSQAVARLLAKNGVKEVEKFIESRPTKPKKEAPKEEPKKEVVEESTEEAASPEAEASESQPEGPAEGDQPVEDAEKKKDE